MFADDNHVQQPLPRITDVDLRIIPGSAPAFLLFPEFHLTVPKKSLPLLLVAGVVLRNRLFFPQGGQVAGPDSGTLIVEVRVIFGAPIHGPV